MKIVACRSHLLISVHFCCWCIMLHDMLCDTHLKDERSMRKDPMLSPQC